MSRLARTAIPSESCTCAQQDVGLHIRHRPEQNQLVTSAALTAQRWKLGVEECSNGPALRDWHLELDYGLALSQGVEQMRSQEVVALENTAVWNVNAAHDLAIRM